MSRQLSPTRSWVMGICAAYVSESIASGGSGLWRGMFIVAFVAFSAYAADVIGPPAAPTKTGER